MRQKLAKRIFEKVMEKASITPNGNNPWDIHIKDERLYNQVLSKWSLGLGEAYVEGWWDCQALDQFFYRIFTHLEKGSLINKKLMVVPAFFGLITIFKSFFLNMQTKKKALVVGEDHYDKGNDLYSRMLDSDLNYTCAYWKTAKTLDEAQQDKLDLVCKKIHLKPGMRVLDIGCGWGSFAKFAASKYGAEVVGITISKEQLELGKERCKGLPIELRFQDYRDVREKFDRIVSLGMFEHVGYKNYKTYMKIAHRTLADDGLFLLHTIGSKLSYRRGDPWIEKYIFPNGMLPSLQQISKNSEKLFVLEDLHNFGAFYDKTLMSWYLNFNHGWKELKSLYDDRFQRLWNYYLLCCAGAFRSRKLQLWQIVFSKYGIHEGYHSVR